MRSPDYTRALAGAETPQGMMQLADQLLDAADSCRTPDDIRDCARMAYALGKAGRHMARENVDYASKAKQLPTVYLGVDSNRQFPAGIAAGTSQRVVVTPAIPCRVTGFYTDSTFAADFNVDTLKVATLDLVIGQDGVPATMFVSGICLPPVSAPRLPGGSQAEITFNNIGGAARRARAGFAVIPLDDPYCQ